MTSESAKSESVYVRLDEPTLGRLDALVSELSVRALGMRVTRSDALRPLVDRGFGVIEGQQKRKP